MDGESIAETKVEYTIMFNCIKHHEREMNVKSKFRHHDFDVVVSFRFYVKHYSVDSIFVQLIVIHSLHKQLATHQNSIWTKKQAEHGLVILKKEQVHVILACLS